MGSKAGSVSKYITRSGDRLWRYRFDGDPVDGKRQVISKRGFATRGAATTAMHAAMDEYRGGKTVPAPPAPAPPPKETLTDWLRVWLRDYAPQRCTPKTLERYHQLAGYILDATQGECGRLAAAPLAETDHVIIEAAMYELLRIPSKRRNHLSAKSVREVAAVLSVALNKAFKIGKIMINPMLRVELPKAERPETRSLDPDEVRRLRDACRGDWTFPFVEVALATACRRGELLALTWSDIDWMSNTISVSKSLEETKAGLRVKRTKSEKPRKFRIGQTAVAALRFQQEQQEVRRQQFCADYKEGNLVFCEPDGGFLWPSLVSQTIVRRIRKAGIQAASLHTLRHTHASTLLSKGVPLPVVSMRLGHADVNITARIYSHALPEDDVRAADTWDSAVSENSVTTCDHQGVGREARNPLKH
jgi:integrase